MATTNVNFKVKNGLDVGTTLTFNGNLGVGASPSYGTSGQVLTSAGSGNAPTWTTISGSLGYVGNFQTTSSAGTTISLGIASVSTSAGGAVSVTGGATTNTSGSGGSITIAGGAATTGTSTTTGGNVIIKGGSSNSTLGVGGYVEINAGLGSGPSNSGDSNIYIGNTNTTRINVGSSTNTTSFAGRLSFDSGLGYNVLTSTGSPNILSLDNSSLQMNFNANQTLNTSGAFDYNTNIFRGFQTSTGAGRVPVIHSVFSLANSTSSTNTTQSVFAGANDVLSSLEAAKLYVFKGKYYSSFTYSAGFAGGVSINFAFSNGPTAIKYSFKTYPQAAGTTVTQQGVATVTTSAAVVPSSSSSGTYVTEIEGYFTTHATLTSTFTPQFICTATASSSALMQAGSWLEVEKLGTSTQTLIAGNWA